jgi:hypothetical protein
VIDHVGFPVSNYPRYKAFYLQALAPLGYALVMEVQQGENDSPAAGFGANGKPDFWIGGEGGFNRPMHIAITAKDRAAVDGFLSRRVGGGRQGQCCAGLKAAVSSQLLRSLRL